MSIDKHKSPWITVNGQDISDSQLAIQHLQKLFNIKSNPHLSSEQRGAALAPSASWQTTTCTL